MTRATDWRRVGGLVLMAAGAGLAALSRVGDRVGFGASAAFGWKQWVLALTGAVLIAVGAVAVGPLIREIAAWRSRDWRTPAAGGRLDVPALAALTILGLVLVWTRTLGLDQSLWHDEAFSVFTYTRHGPRAILASNEYVPNDHVLFNLLTWLTTQILPEHDATYRMWAVGPALAAAAAMAWWCWRRFEPSAAVGLLLLVVASEVHLELAKEARGYGLTLLAGALMIVSADWLDRSGGRLGLAGFAAAGLIGMLTLPVFVLPFAGCALALCIRRAFRLPVAFTVLAVGIAVLGVYWSLLDDVLGSAHQQFGQQLEWHAVFSAPIVEFAASPIRTALGLDYAGSLLGYELIAAALVLAGIAWLAMRREWVLAGVLVAPVVTTYLVLTIGHFYTVGRFSSFLLFNVLTLMTLGVVALAQQVARVRLLRPVVASALVVFAAFALVHVLELADQWAELPKENFEGAAEVVDGTGIKRVVSDTTRPHGFWIYLGQERLELPPSDQLRQILCTAPAPFLFVQHPLAVPQPPPPDTTCLKRRGAVRVSLAQRRRGGHIDVWIIRRAARPPGGR